MIDEALMIPIMRAAGDLTSTYTSGLSNQVTRTRMTRIAEDLIYAADEYENIDRSW